MTVRGRGWNTSPAQPSQDCALPQEPLWPGIPASVSCVQPLCFPPETGLRSNLQYRIHHSSSDQTLMSLVLYVCVPSSSSELVSPLPCSQLSTSLQSITQGRRQWGRGRGRAGEFGVCFASCLCSRSLSLLPLSHLSYCCLHFFHSNPAPCRITVTPMPVSATPDLWIPKEREECEKLAGLQTIVPGGPLSAVKPPFGSHLSPFFSFSCCYCCYSNVSEIPTLTYFVPLFDWLIKSSDILFRFCHFGK